MSVWYLMASAHMRYLLCNLSSGLILADNAYITLHFWPCVLASEEGKSRPASFYF